MFDVVDDVLERARRAARPTPRCYAERSTSRRIKVYEQEVEQLTAAQRTRRRRARLLGRRRGLRLHLRHSATARSTRSCSAPSTTPPSATRTSSPPCRSPAASLPTCTPYDPRLGGDRRAADRARAGGRGGRPRRRPARQDRRGHHVRRRRRRGVHRQLGRRARHVPRQPVLRLRLRARRAGRPGRDRATRTPSAAPSRTSTPPPCGREAAARACPLLGAQKCPSMKAPVVLDPFVGGVVLRRAQLRAHRRRRAEGPLAVRRPRGQAGGRRAPRARRRRHASPTASTARRSTARASPAGARRSSPAACCRASCTTPTRRARRGRARTGNGLRGSYSSLPGVRPTNLIVERPRDAAGRHRRRHRARRAGHRRRRRALGRQPHLGRVLGGHQRHPHRERPAHDAGARGHAGRRYHQHAHQRQRPRRRRPLGARAAASSRRRCVIDGMSISGT